MVSGTAHLRIAIMGYHNALECFLEDYYAVPQSTRIQKWWHTVADDDNDAMLTLHFPNLQR